MNKKLIIAIAVIAVLLIAGIVSLLSGSFEAHGTLSITVFPEDAKLSIDKKTQVSPGNITLAPGAHSIVVSSDGFASQTISVTISKNQTTKQAVTLVVSNPTGQAYIDKYSEQAAAKQGDAPAENDVPSQTDQLAGMLPYGGSDFEIDYSTEQENAGDASTTTIEILTSSDAGTAHALSWIKAQGFDPQAIHYITRPKDIDD